MSLEIVWGPKYNQNTTTKKWSIRAKVIENGKERDYRRTGFLNKKEAKLSWLDYLAVNQDEVLGDIAVNKTNFPAPVEIEDRKPFENSDSCNMLAVQPDELYQPTDNVYFNQHKERHIGLTVYELNEKYKLYKLQILKAGSMRSESDVIRRFILPVFGDWDVGEITSRDVLDWQRNINERGYKYRYKSKIFCGFTALLNFGMKFYGLTENVASKAGNFKNGEPPKEMQVWSEEEFWKVHAQMKDKLYRYFFSFMYFMGTRKGEALALTWQDVDFANQEVRINKSLNRKQPEKGVAVVLATDPTPSSMGWHKINNRNYEVTTPKNKTSIRRVWMTESVLKILKDLRAESEKDYDFAETDFVFGGKLPLSDQTVRRKMDEYADKAGVKRIRIHDLRHSHASLVISQGLKIEDIILLSKRLGHRDIKETLNTYSHLFPNAQRRILEAIDKGAEM